MPSPKDKILVFQYRTLSQRIEAVFDFMRLCRKAWFMLVAVLFLPVCLVLTSASFFNSSVEETRVNPNTFNWLDNFFWWESPFFTCVALLGVWAIFVHVYSLLAAYEDNDFSLDGIKLKSLLPYMKASLLPALLPTVVLVMVAVLMWMAGNVSPFFFFVILLLSVPLSLFAPVFMIERPGVVSALVKAVRLGVASWFTLAFSMVMMVIFGFIMLLSVNVPWLLARAFYETFSNTNQGWGYVMLLRFSSLALAVVGYLSCYMVAAMVALLCVYHYGFIAEVKGESSIYGNDIDDFEKL